MRDFETDFDYISEESVKVSDTHIVRKDSCESISFIPNRSDNIEHQVRIAAHQERIQREMQEL